MSQLLIQRYFNELTDLQRVSGSKRETVVREAFKDLLKAWGRSLNLIFVPEHEYETPAHERRYIDGALLYELRVPFGYWEAKDQKDNLDEEIAAKFRRGYPKDNIIFEDGRAAVLYQNGQEAARCDMTHGAELERLLGVFFAWQRPEIAQFRKAVEQFKADLPAVLRALRERIEAAQAKSPDFRKAAGEFLSHARATINPALTDSDIREMLIQHVLTEEIFSKVFGEDDFHRENNVAKRLYELEATFFTGGVKRDTLRALEPYYAAIRGAAAQIVSHHEKQTFLKVVYENFYKVYNPKAADRLGVVYTPNEIVRFMIESADFLCQHHFGRRLIDRDVEILDPAAGTGTFIAELIEHFRGQPDKLRYKYHEELHANEAAILPYYVANLNIEATYAAIMGGYDEFRNLCFVDTLDNLGWKGAMADLFGAVSAENVARIRRQNERRISVIIGNPPYNANQKNENENNKNREYPAIDRRIRETYVAASNAQKTKQYDMYKRFFRWACDRLNENGIVAFVTNSAFAHRPGDDGFRKVVAEEFNDIYVVDLGGDVRSDPRLSGTRNNVFGIQTGVAISFLVKRTGARGCRIRYSARPQLETASEKLLFLSNSRFESIQFTEIRPTAKHDWISIAPTDFDSLLSIADRPTKLSSVTDQERAIFKLFSLGIATNRDEWIYGETCKEVAEKCKFFVDFYTSEQARWLASGKPNPIGDWVRRDIKWTSELEKHLCEGTILKFDARRIQPAAYRPFYRRFIYYDRVFIHRLYQQHNIFPPGRDVHNACIVFSDVGSRTAWSVLAVDRVADLHFGAAVDAYQQVPRYRFVDGHRIDNITDWALDQFRAHYASAKLPRPITKDAIFHYVYGVLHDPVYRETYADNLRRAFPRIPLHPDFWRWHDWGKELMRLHLGYETIRPWKLNRIEPGGDASAPPKALLKSDHGTGTITLDTATMLTGIPPEAWRYRLGNRTALDWVLDQHKERAPKDPVVREKFNSYRFADYKEQVIDLLARVARVSVETVGILDAMRALPR